MQTYTVTLGCMPSILIGGGVGKTLNSGRNQREWREIYYETLLSLFILWGWREGSELGCNSGIDSRIEKQQVELKPRT